jgi:hypothetical protein
MKQHLAIGVLLLALWAGSALASDFDGQTVEQIQANPAFVADTTSMSSTTNSGRPDAPHIYWWIGYIPDGDQRIYFTSYGEALTCVVWERTGEWVPVWVAENLEKLAAEGIIKLEK